MSLTEPGNPEQLRAYFWLVCMEAQVWEMKKALAENNFNQYRKELADCALVAFDGIRLLGLGDGFNVILTRAVQNVSKFTPEGLVKSGPRDTQYYLDKIAKIKAKLGVTD